MARLDTTIDMAMTVNGIDAVRVQFEKLSAICGDAIETLEAIKASAELLTVTLKEIEGRGNGGV